MTGSSAAALHRPSAVLYPVRRSRFLAWLLAAGLALGGLLLAAWAWQMPKGATTTAHALWWRLALALAAVLLVAVWLARWYLSQPQGDLHWDVRGQWTFRPLAGAALPQWSCPQLQARLDWQSHLLLYRPSRGASHRWLWADASAAPGRWSDFRRAVYFQDARRASKAGRGARFEDSSPFPATSVHSRNDRHS